MFGLDLAPFGGSLQDRPQQALAVADDLAVIELGQFGETARLRQDQPDDLATAGLQHLFAHARGHEPENRVGRARPWRRCAPIPSIGERIVERDELFEQSRLRRHVGIDRPFRDARRARHHPGACRQSRSRRRRPGRPKGWPAACPGGRPRVAEGSVSVSLNPND